MGLGAILAFQSAPSSEAESLFFSSYVEGSAYNKAFGIYNPTGADVALDNYAVIDCFNGCVFG